MMGDDEGQSAPNQGSFFRPSVFYGFEPGPVRDHLLAGTPRAEVRARADQRAAMPAGQTGLNDLIAQRSNAQYFVARSASSRVALKRRRDRFT